MIRLYGLLLLINLALLVVALIDCLSAEEFLVRNLPKWAWVLIILLFSPVGAIVWFVAGRPQADRTAPGRVWRPGSGFPESERPRPVGPDDDPEFLRGQTSGQRDATSQRDDERLFSAWEADLRRREEELRRRERDSDSS